MSEKENQKVECACCGKFEKLWQSCYGDSKLDWEKNPVVKVIEFKRVEGI